MQNIIKAFSIHISFGLLMVFFYSLFLEVPQFFYTAKFIDILSNWRHLSLIQNYGVPLHFNAESYRTMHQFYISHPPFSYYFFYLFNVFFGILNYFWINFLIVLANAFFLYLTVCRIMLISPSQKISWFSLVASFIYISHPATYVFQLFQLHPDIFACMLQAIFVYVALKMLSKNKIHSPKYHFLFFITLGLLTYSSWFGLFYALVILGLLLFSFRKSYYSTSHIIVCILSVVVPLVVMYFQYSKVQNWWQLLISFKNIYLKESAFNNGFFSIQFEIFKNHIKYLWNFYLVFFILLFLTLKTSKTKFIFTKNGYRYIAIAVLPIILFFLVLFRYASNNYTVLFSVPFLTTLIVIWIEKMRKLRSKYFIWSLLSLVVIGNIISAFSLFRIGL